MSSFQFPIYAGGTKVHFFFGLRCRLFTPENNEKLENGHRPQKAAVLVCAVQAAFFHYTSSHHSAMIQAHIEPLSRDMDIAIGKIRIFRMIRIETPPESIEITGFPLLILYLCREGHTRMPPALPLWDKVSQSIFLFGT